MKKLLALGMITICSMAFAQQIVSSTLSKLQIESALIECTIVSTERNLDSDRLQQGLDLKNCGGHLKVTKSNDGADAQLTISNVNSCKYLEIGISSASRVKNGQDGVTTRAYNMDGDNGSYRKSLKISQTLINTDTKSVRLALHAKDGSPCELIKINLGKKTTSTANNGSGNSDAPRPTPPRQTPPTSSGGEGY